MYAVEIKVGWDEEIGVEAVKISWSGSRVHNIYCIGPLKTQSTIGIVGLFALYSGCFCLQVFGPDGAIFSRKRRKNEHAKIQFWPKTI